MQPFKVHICVEYSRMYKATAGSAGSAGQIRTDQDSSPGKDPEVPTQVGQIESSTVCGAILHRVSRVAPSPCDGLVRHGQIKTFKTTQS